MATQTVCDQCGKVLSPHLSSYRVIWSNDFGRPPRDYCSKRCAVLALGGDWAEGLTSRDPDELSREIAPEPKSDLASAVATSNLRMAARDRGFRLVPWPPSKELIERVATVLSVRFGSEADGWPVYAADARVVLDVIGADQ